MHLGASLAVIRYNEGFSAIKDLISELGMVTQLSEGEKRESLLKVRELERQFQASKRVDVQLKSINARLATLRLTSLSSQLLAPMQELFFVPSQKETLLAEKTKPSRKRKRDEGISVCLRSKIGGGWRGSRRRMDSF